MWILNWSRGEGFKGLRFNVQRLIQIQGKEAIGKEAKRNTKTRHRGNKAQRHKVEQIQGKGNSNSSKK